MIIGHKFWGLPIILGLVLAIVYPYPAFQLNTVIYFLLFSIMFFTSLIYDFSNNNFSSKNLAYIFLFLFFGFLLMPAVQWFLSQFMVQDHALQQGLFYASLSPIAIVAPHLVKLKNGKDSLSYQLMWLTTFMSPLLLLLMSLLFSPQHIDINLYSYIKDLAFLCFFPILLSSIFKKIIKKENVYIQNIKKYLPSLNFICIGLLSYTLMGTMLVKVGFSAISYRDLFAVLLLALIQDFGTYLFAKFILPENSDPTLKKTLMISISIKNVALTAGLLLFYQPKMAFAAAAGLLAHALFFIYLSFNSKDEKSNA
ncbi:MAG: hypothetical protein ABL930_03655 [Pseudobdellovibrio sp.]